MSHNTSVSEEELTNIDMLPKIGNNMFLTPELTPTFTVKDEDLIKILGIITRIADGQGFISNSGAHGQRGYDQKIMFTWVGAVCRYSISSIQNVRQLRTQAVFL